MIMRRYFFDVLLGEQIGEDEAGQLLPDLEAVQGDALRTLADAANELTEFPPSLKIQVRDKDGPVMSIKVVFEIERCSLKPA